jgi:hypothetical protein
MYRRGVGVPQNYATAYFFAQRALTFKADATDAKALVDELAPRLPSATRVSTDFWASRQRSRLDSEFACMSWSGEVPKPHDVFSFRAGASIHQMAADIVYYSGLVQNFDIAQGNVPNAAAEIQGTRRRVVFNPNFLQQLHDLTGTPWGAYSVMAHEIGHHLQGHTIIPGGSRPPLELQADEFSGFILARMGSTLDEAQAAMSRLVGEQGSATHPGRSDRLASIKSGWDRGRSLGPVNSGSQPLPPIRNEPAPPPIRFPEQTPLPPPQMPMPMPQVARACQTQFGACPMMVPVPVGSSCYCATMAGPIPGVAR